MASTRDGNVAKKGRKGPAPATEHAARIDKVVFLGTGSAVPVPGKRNMSSLAVLLSSGAVILVDCGEGTQHHMRVSTLVKPAKIEVVLITHLHGDHCFGIFGLLHTMATQGRKDPVLLVGPAGLQQMVDTVFRCSGGWFPEDSFALEFLEIPTCRSPGGEDLVGSDGFGPSKQGFNPERCARAQPVPLGERAGLQIQAVPMVHSVPDWGYILTERGRPGTLDVARALARGVPARSPLLGKLKRGEEVQLEDGTKVLPSQVLGPATPGRTLAVLQDTCDASSAIEPCRGAALVIHEATFEECMEQDAIDKGHSTSVMAARFAAACDAQRLVLTHFSARYSNSTSTEAVGRAAPACGRTAVAVAASVKGGGGDRSNSPSACGTCGTFDAAVGEGGLDNVSTATTVGGVAIKPGADPAELLGEEARRTLGGRTPVVVAKDFMVLRGDRDFEPEVELAVKRCAWCR